MKLENDSYEKIIENLHDGLYLVDQDRVITYWNKGAEKISGFAASEVIGKSCSDNILTHADSEFNNLCIQGCPLAASMVDGKLRDAEVYMHHRNGHRIPVDVRVSTLTDKGGNIIGGIELFTDISNHDGKILQVTISVGAALASEGDNIESLIKRADVLLYKSKAAGRNCVTSGCA